MPIVAEDANLVGKRRIAGCVVGSIQSHAGDAHKMRCRDGIGNARILNPPAFRSRVGTQELTDQRAGVTDILGIAPRNARD